MKQKLILPLKLVGIGIGLMVAGLLLISRSPLALHAKSLGEILRIIVGAYWLTISLSVPQFIGKEKTSCLENYKGNNPFLLGMPGLL